MLLSMKRDVSMGEAVNLYLSAMWRIHTNLIDDLCCEDRLRSGVRVRAKGLS